MAPSISICDLRFEHHPTGLGVPVTSPRLSWRFASPGNGPLPNWTQTSYEVEVERAGTEEASAVKVVSDSSTLNPWPYKPLVSRERVRVRVRAEGISRKTLETESGEAVATDWSQWKYVEAGLLHPADWKADFITASEVPPGQDKSGKCRPIRLRKTFTLPAGAKGKGRLYITALGLYEAYINGTRVGDELMSPGWTSYHHRLLYQVYDVSGLLRHDESNTLAIEVAEGWYAGRLLWGDGISHLYGDKIGALAQLEVSGSGDAAQVQADPSFRLVTDGTWRSALSPILESGIYDGESYDMRLEEDSWANIGSGNDPWQAVAKLTFPETNLIAAPCPPVRITQEVSPIAIFSSPSGKTLVDFGQNLVGGIRIHHLKKPKDHKLRMRYAEVLEKGELGTRPLRNAKATDTVIFSATGVLKDWSPHFTFHGFRYLELEGWSPEDEESPLTKDSLSAVVFHTDMERTGLFECSNELVNKLHTNVVWSMRDNFLSIPTDCPQRDERLGWTGDIQVFTPTAAFLYDCGGMLGSWMEDVVSDQKDTDGYVPFVVPNALIKGPWPKVAQAIWDDVVIIVPWKLYQAFGDIAVLHKSYSGMQMYIDNILPRGEDGLWKSNLWQLGDWLDPNAPPAEPGRALTDGALVADEYLVYVTGLMAKISAVINKPEDAKRYDSDYARLQQAFREKYITPAGLVVGDTQTSLALALAFSLHQADPDTRTAETDRQRKFAGTRLAKHVRTARFRVSTGFAGTPVILHALSSTGNLQLAYRMLLEKECPSWLYAVSMGSTTIWERWDSMLPDGSINPGEMTSFNHYALGSVADWLHKVVGGLAPLEPAWRRFLVAPRPGGDVTSAKVEFRSPSGVIKCAWELGPPSQTCEHGLFKLSLTVPPNTTALVVLPDEEWTEDVESRGSLHGSGVYEFLCPFRPEGRWPPKPLLTEYRDTGDDD